MTATISVLIEHAQLEVQSKCWWPWLMLKRDPLSWKMRINKGTVWKHNRKWTQLSALLHRDQNLVSPGRVPQSGAWWTAQQMISFCKEAWMSQMAKCSQLLSHLINWFMLWTDPHSLSAYSHHACWNSILIPRQEHEYSQWAISDMHLNEM